MNHGERGYGIKVGDPIDYYHKGMVFRGIVTKLQRKVAVILRANQNYEPTKRRSIVDYRAIFAVKGRPFSVPENASPEAQNP